MSNPAVAEARTPVPNIIDIYMHEMATRARTIQSEVATSNAAPAAASGSTRLDVYLNSTRAGTASSETALANSAASTAPSRSMMDVYLHSARTTAAQNETASSNSTASAASAASGRSIIDIYLDSVTDGHLGADPAPNGNAPLRSTASTLSAASNTARDASLPPQAAAVANAATVVASAANGGGDGDTGEAARADTQRPVTPLMRVKLFELSTSSSESEDDNTRPAVIGSGGATGAADSRQAASPPPNCAICLGRCKNKCFTDSCMHQFCFKCLCEWSKVKPECPLCKQTFKSIIHNVKSMDQFEEYHVQPPTVQIPHRPIEVYRQLPYLFDDVVVEPHYWETPRRSSSLHRLLRPGNYYSQILNGASGSAGGNSGTGGGNGSNSGVAVQNQFLHRSELLDMYRREAPDAIASNSTLSQLWRRFIYDRKLYALPVCDITGRFRDSSARFYRDNPAQIHRLMPWISRDIICLLRNTEHDVSTLLERINETLIQSNILSPAFRRRLQPYLGTKTSHFIHELNNFARSPYDMIGYDRAVQYLPQSAEEIVIEFSSSGSSDEGNSNEVVQSSERVRRNEYRVQLRAANASAAAAAAASQPPMVNLLSFTISTTSEGTEAPGVTVAVSGRNTQSTAINLTTHNRATDPIIDLEELDVLETASGAQMPSTTPTITENIELTSSSSDECEFVLERKPPHLRTPELVSLNSESDSDVVFVEETKPLRKVTYSTSEDEPLESKNTLSHEQRVHAKPVRASAAQAASATVKSEQELYNVGASTSTGLRSSGGARGLPSLREQSRSSGRQLRRRRSPRGTKEPEQKTTQRGKRKSSDSNNCLSDSESSVSDSEDDDYSVRRRHVKSKRTTNKKRAARSSRKLTSKRSASSSNEHNRKRIRSKDSDRAAGKKHKSDNIQTHSESSSDEDEGQSLIELKRRLQEQKQSRGKEPSSYSGACDDAGNDDADNHDGDDQGQEEEDKSMAEDVKPAGSSISLYGDPFEDNAEATVSGEADENTMDAMADSDDEPRYDDADNGNSLEPSCSHKAARTTELAEVSHFVGATSNTASAADTEAASVDSRADDEDNTFPSVTQAAVNTLTTTVTTTSTAATAATNNERLRAPSRTSTRSFGSSTRTSTASDNSSSSASSSATSLSSPSLCSASSAGEEEDSSSAQLNNGQASATQLRFEQLFDHTYTGEPWLMDELGNATSASYDGDGDDEEQRQQQHPAGDAVAAQRHGADNETAVALTDFSNACASLLLNSDSSLLSLTDLGDSSDAEHENLLNNS